MYGARRRIRGGQLALMDAIVFFSVALLICSVMLSRTYEEFRYEVEAPESDAAYDASLFLEVLLRGSIGEGMRLNVSGLMTIHPTTTIGECLAMEASALLAGEQLEEFEGMNNYILVVSERIAGPQVVPHIWILHSLNDTWISVVEIEDRPPASENRRAAWFDLPANGVDRCRITLVLEPALLPECRCV